MREERENRTKKEERKALPGGLGLLFWKWKGGREKGGEKRGDIYRRRERMSSVLACSLSYYTAHCKRK